MSLLKFLNTKYPSYGFHMTSGPRIGFYHNDTLILNPYENPARDNEVIPEEAYNLCEGDATALADYNGFPDESCHNWDDLNLEI